MDRDTVLRSGVVVTLRWVTLLVFGVRSTCLWVTLLLSALLLEALLLRCTVLCDVACLFTLLLALLERMAGLPFR